MASADELLNDGRPDEACSSGKEYAHVFLLKCSVQGNQCGASAVAAIPSNSSRTCGESVNCPAARFSRRWATDDVPGINRMLGERFSNHASATCIGVAPSRPATSDRVDDCSGVNPPSGKYGTYGMPCLAKASIRASSWRWARL